MDIGMNVDKNKSECNKVTCLSFKMFQKNVTPQNACGSKFERKIYVIDQTSSLYFHFSLFKLINFILAIQIILKFHKET